MTLRSCSHGMVNAGGNQIAAEATQPSPLLQECWPVTVRELEKGVEQEGLLFSQIGKPRSC